MLDPSVYLQAQGWQVGKGLKHNSISRPIPAPRKRDLNGIGRDRDDGHLFHSSLFDAAAKAIQIKVDDSDDSDSDKDKDKDADTPQSLNISRTSTGILSTRTPSSAPSVPASQVAFGQAKQSIAKRKLYSRFTQGQTYNGGELQSFLREQDDSKQRVPPQVHNKKKRKAKAHKPSRSQDQGEDGYPYYLDAPLQPKSVRGEDNERSKSMPVGFGNQYVAVSDEKRRMLEKVINSFNAPIRYGFAYGSGVFQQPGYTDKDKPLVDFIVATTHPYHWHSINIQQNPTHYPFLAKILGSKAINYVQRAFGARVWYVSMVEVDGIPLKYGVVSVDDLCRDLLDWETLYVSGRMHKPVRIIKDDARVRLAQQVNLTSALRTALLLLPHQFSQQELYEKITALSYSGDPRMQVGENPAKVANIVAAQMEQFHSLYEPLAMHLRGVRFVPGWRRVPQGQRAIRQPMNTQARAGLVAKLPLHLRRKLRSHYDVLYKDVKHDDGVYWTRVVTDEQFERRLEMAVAEIVRKPAVTQSLKGVLTAGPTKALLYVWQKLCKPGAGLMGFGGVSLHPQCAKQSLQPTSMFNYSLSLDTTNLGDASQASQEESQSQHSNQQYPHSQPQPQRRPRHGKVVYDLHAQFIAFYATSQPSPHHLPVFWQGSRERGSLKFRFRTRDGGSICILLDDGNYELCMPLECVTYLGMLPIDESSGGGGAGGGSNNPDQLDVNHPNYAVQLERCLSGGKITFELGVDQNALFDYRRREPNRYVRDHFNTQTRDAACAVKHVKITIHHSVTKELATAMVALVVRSLKLKFYPQHTLNASLSMSSSSSNSNGSSKDGAGYGYGYSSSDDLWYINPRFNVDGNFSGGMEVDNKHDDNNKTLSTPKTPKSQSQFHKQVDKQQLQDILESYNKSPSLSPASSMPTLSPVSPDTYLPLPMTPMGQPGGPSQAYPYFQSQGQTQSRALPYTGLKMFDTTHGYFAGNYANYAGNTHTHISTPANKPHIKGLTRSQSQMIKSLRQLSMDDLGGLSGVSVTPSPSAVAVSAAISTTSERKPNVIVGGGMERAPGHAVNGNWKAHVLEEKTGNENLENREIAGIAGITATRRNTESHSGSRSPPLKRSKARWTRAGRAQSIGTIGDAGVLRMGGEATSTSRTNAKANAPAHTRKTAPLVRISNQFKTFKPLTPSLRHVRIPLTDISNSGPFKPLTISKRKTGGRNSSGRVVSRHIGGGHKRRVRTLDFARIEGGVRRVVRLEYDPNRSAHIALLRGESGASEAHPHSSPWSYIIAPKGLKAGDTVQSFRTLSDAGIAKLTAAASQGDFSGDVLSRGGDSDKSTSTPTPTKVSSLDLGLLRMITVRPGNVLPLRLMPVGTLVHCIGLKVGGNGLLCRSAGSYGQVIALHSGPRSRYAQIRLQSGEVRLVLMECCATVGVVSNEHHHLKSLGKAGRSRWLGRRPSVRGVAMNTVDHPLGGGRGKSKGDKDPRSPWGLLSKGKRTRRPKDTHGNKYVVRQRVRVRGRK
ncbi:hypothetical protein E3P98_00124 [Wallemia ichthyophaga]|nr:hypothetical protein E3P98_00124 [Wallemia ichthyophaga]